MKFNYCGLNRARHAEGAGRRRREEDRDPERRRAKQGEVEYMVGKERRERKKERREYV